MNRIVGQLIIGMLSVVVLVSCQNSSSKKNVVEKKKGVFEAVFIDVNDTIIPSDISDDVTMHRKLLSNLHLTDTSDFWGDKSNFYMHSMGRIGINESHYYYLKASSSGGVVLKINNKDVIVNKQIHCQEVDTSKAYIHEGAAIFEIQYFSGQEKPYLVVEWSKDGENYEVIPDSLFGNLEAFKVEDWESASSDPSELSVQNNVLSEEELSEGWKLLFDGKSLSGWHSYNKQGEIGSKWKVQDNMLIFEGRKRFEFYVAGRKIEMGPVNKALDGGGDIVTDEAFENFELTLEWKLSEAGNNGIFYTVQESDMYDECWKTSPEMQVLDNQKHKDGLIYKHRSGDLYDLIAFSPNRVKLQGKWNKVKIVKNNGKVEHWLNGVKGLEYDMNSDEWKDMIAKSKFAKLKDFAKPGPGKIGFQDHDNLVYYKNIKIRVID